MEKLWNKEYIKVMSVNFLMYFAFYLLTPLLPIYLSERFTREMTLSDWYSQAIPSPRLS